MLTWRRGIARVGWVLLAIWLIMCVVGIIGSRAGSPHAPPLDITVVLQLIAAVASVPIAVFLLWRVLLWIGQGFWEDSPVATATATPKIFHIHPGFWTVRTMALLGAILFVVFGILSGNSVGGLVANAAVGAIIGGVVARFLPKH